MKTLLLLFALCLAAVTPTRAQPAAEGAPAQVRPETHTRSHTDLDVFPVTPVKRPDGKKWRIGYFESGNYGEYPRTLGVTVEGLEKLGWLYVPDIPEDLNSRQLWDFLVDNVDSRYVEFVRDAWWQPGNFDETLRLRVRHAIMKRVKEKGDIDLIITMGTLAGQDMAVMGAPVPTVVGSTSDPVGAHIVRSAEDSGLDNLHARVQPERYQRQVRLFHDVVPFKRLGLVFENSQAGRTYSAVDAVMQVAKERGFEVLTCDAESNGISLEQAEKNVMDCYARLAPRIDAVYVTVHRGITPRSLPSIVETLRKARVPSFSMLGSEEVQQGLLLSLAQASYSYVGLFYAETIARIFNGAKARQLSQIWIDPAKIALNLETARRIGFDPPLDILLAADEVYESK